MAFFRRELGPVERFENALNDKQAARQKLAGRVAAAEAVVAEKRAAAERLAVAGAANARLERAEAAMRVVDERARALRAELADLDEQIVSTERALTEAKAQRDRDRTADAIEALAASIEQAIPGFDAGAAALVAAATGGTMAMPEAAAFSASVDAVRREVLSAAELVCFELRSAAVRTRVGNSNIAAATAAPALAQKPFPEIERQLIYTLNPLVWREGSELRRVPAFALVALPKRLLPVALAHQHVDYMNARRVQTLMHVHGSGESAGEPSQDDPQLVDLDALAAYGGESAKADVKAGVKADSKADIKANVA
jgi:hypothetical protein